MNTHADKTQENKSKAVATSLPKLQPNSDSAFQFADNRPEAIAQRKLQEAINNSPQVKQLQAYQAMANHFSSQTAQRKENNTGLPDNLKSGVENLSGYSLDDVKVHYNSDKPSQLQAHAYAQGTDIHMAPGQEMHLPHEAWHVVQQKQGRVKPTLQMKGGVQVNDDAGLEKEADVMGAMALSSAESKTNQTLNAAPSLKSVFQRQIKVNSVGVDKDAILDAKVAAIKGRVHFWLTKKGMTATLKANVQDVGDQVDASKSNVKATRYLDENLSDQVSTLLAKYDTENRPFGNDAQLESQLIQDVKLTILKLDDIVGIANNDGQFSTSDKSGGANLLRIYRTTTRTDWHAYLQSKNIAGLLHGHGGALGQALDYFYKSRNSAKDGPLYDNVIFEIELDKTATGAIDYAEVTSGGEGGGPKGGKLTGKSEKNDILGEENIFSVNLAACSELIMSMKPKIKRIDERKGEDTQFSKRLFELSIKKGEYPLKTISEAERLELDQLRALG